MINGYFPTPYPNETVYSILARYFQRLEGFGYNHVMKKIYQGGAVPSDVLPNDIIKLVSNTPLRFAYTPERIIEKHTLFQLYVTYSGEKMYQQLLQNMLFKERTDKITLAGLDYEQIEKWKFPRFCPKCAELDTRMFGEPYWHREHQIPGIKVCPHHKEVTYDVGLLGVSDNSGKRRSFLALDSSMINKKYTIDKNPVVNNELFENHWQIAINAWDILNSKALFELEEVKQKYQVKLTELGYCWEGGRRQNGKIKIDFISYYGEDFLGDISCGIEAGTQNWLAKTLRGKCFRHPIKQLLVTIFLFKSFKGFQNADTVYNPFGNAPWLCLNPLANHYKQRVIEKCILRNFNNVRYGVFSCECGFEYTRHIGTDDGTKYNMVLSYGHVFENKVKEMAQREQLSEKQVLKKIGISKYLAKYGLPNKHKYKNKVDMSKKEPYKAVIMSLLTEHPDITRKRIQDMATKEFQWIRKNDREWFNQNMPKALSKLPFEYRDIDWDELNKNMCDRINNARATILMQQGKPQRITKARLLKVSKAGSILEHRANYLKAFKLLNALLETKTEYQIRCINWAVQELVSKGEKIIMKETIRNMTSIRTDDSLEVTRRLDEACKIIKGRI